MSDHFKRQISELAIPTDIWHEVLYFLSRRQLQNVKLAGHSFSRFIQAHFPIYPLHCIPGMWTDGLKVKLADHPGYGVSGLSPKKGSRTVLVSDILPYIGNLCAESFWLGLHCRRSQGSDLSLDQLFHCYYLLALLWKRTKLVLKFDSLEQDCDDCHQLIKGLCARQLFQCAAIEVRHLCRVLDLWPMLGLLLRTCTSIFDWQFICIKGYEVLKLDINASLCSETIQFLIHNKLEWKRRGECPN
uniref:F-box domain-containing protein n=1 Tax=Ditylenchus dipsaci TaxID=166011 RepID=A0A915EJP7_9BILA